MGKQNAVPAETLTSDEWRALYVTLKKHWVLQEPKGEDLHVTTREMGDGIKTRPETEKRYLVKNCKPITSSR